MGYKLIERYDMTFLPLDLFEWSPKTHAEFIKSRFFQRADEHLKSLGLQEHLTKMILFKGRGLLLKYHVHSQNCKRAQGIRMGVRALCGLSVSRTTYHQRCRR